MIIIPAGVAHECLKSTPSFSVYGLYPQGQKYDMRSGKGSELKSSLAKINKVPLPKSDPLFGTRGPLTEAW